jgi:anaerobic magnesium-protoporphyrin IX monomethyl ester cyclase
LDIENTMADNIDILFIHPGDRQQIYQALGDEFCAIEPPVFAGLYATYARNKGLSAAIIDGPALQLSAEQIADSVVSDYHTTLVVLVVYGNQPSASTQNMTSAGKIATLIKKRNPNINILMTGTHPAALPERTMQEETIDFVCDGEGPVTIVKLAKHLNGQANDISDIPSLWRREGGVIHAPESKEELIRDLDGEMPGIAWDLLPMELYRSHNWHAFDHIEDRSYAAIHTSLGCPYSCSFCCINAPFGKPNYRMWSPETVVAEIDLLVCEYGVKNIKFVDEMFVLNKRHVLDICDLLIERDYDVNIWAYARVDTVKEEYLGKLKAAGFNWLCLGIESASDEVRDGADKSFSNEEIIDIVRQIQDAGIHVLGNYIFGLPDDTQANMQATLDLALEVNSEFANFYSAMAYPGSPLYTTALKEGAELPEQWHQFSQHSFDSLPLANEFCRSGEIVKFRDEAWNTYFCSPVYLELVRDKFGPEVVDHVRRMTEVPLARRDDVTDATA